MYFQYGDVEPVGQLGRLPATVYGHQGAGGIVEGRHDENHIGVVLGHRGAERVRPDPLVVQGHRDPAGTGGSEDVQAPGPAGGLDNDYPVAAQIAGRPARSPASRHRSPAPQSSQSPGLTGCNARQRLPSGPADHVAGSRHRRAGQEAPFPSGQPVPFAGRAATTVPLPRLLMTSPRPTQLLVRRDDGRAAQR